jgi:hypothetical protein
MKKWEISCDSVTNQVSSIEKDILEMERVKVY